jgi:hypothetical protein
MASSRDSCDVQTTGGGPSITRPHLELIARSTRKDPEASTFGRSSVSRLGMEFFAKVPDADPILGRTGCREKAFEWFVRRFAA